jgi:hypothetical protein
MAVSLYSDVALKQSDPANNDMLDAQRGDAKVRCVQPVIELDAAAADTEFALCRLYKGDEVLMNSRIMFDDLGTGVTLDIGDDDDTDAADDDRYADGIDVASAAGSFVFDSVATCIDKVPYRIQKDCWLKGMILGAAATGTLKGTIFIARAGG